MHRALLVVATLLLAGCAEEPMAGTPGVRDDEPRPYSLPGTFTQERTQATLDAWCEVARDHANECALMESFPEQYRLGFVSLAACEAARQRLLAIEHVRPGTCVPETGGGGAPEQPTGSPPQGGDEAWSLHGTFTIEYDEADIDRWCELATELGHTCALMKSQPPQFSWRFGSYETCDAARQRLGSIRNVTTRPCDDVATADIQYDVGDCDEGDFNCGEPGMARHTVREARFGP